MKTDLEFVFPEDSVATAARIMRERNIGFLPVCDTARKVLGTVTDRDVAIRAPADRSAEMTLVKDVMTREVIACRPGDSIYEAEALMSENQKSRILCVDDEGTLVGVISLSDIAHDESAARTAATLRQITDRETKN